MHPSIIGDYSFTPQQTTEKVEEADLAAAIAAGVVAPDVVTDPAVVGLDVKEVNGWRVGYRTQRPDNFENYKWLCTI